MWNKIKNGAYSWLQLYNDKNKKLYRLIEIYSNFNEIVDSVKNLNTKIDIVKLLKNAPDEDWKKYNIYQILYLSSKVCFYKITIVIIKMWVMYYI